MGHGLGTTQQTILGTLEASDQLALTTAALAEKLGRSPRQIRTAVHALEDRGLVKITKEHVGWHGAGEYGTIRERGTFKDLPTAMVVKAGEPWPRRMGAPYSVDRHRGRQVLERT